MMKNHLILILVLIISFKLFASSAFQPSTVHKASPLLVSWTKKNRPMAIGWKGGDIFKIDNSQLKLSLPRKGLYSIPTKLIIIPADEDNAPQLITINKEINQHQVKPNEINQDKLWLWGITPKSNCFNSRTSLDASFIYGKRLRSEFKGLSLWEIKKDNLPKKIVLNFLYQNHDIPKSIESSIFVDATKADYNKCNQYFGGGCKFLFMFNNHTWGKSYEIKFERKLISPLNNNCPV
ncbi:MAG: hypothetical protein HON90_14110 [Halobacteriovoraceae bacterium]|jgi:hypothetical protein|nr:hypothetical protein [Halobacteriovoraceae bacterium]